jgi:exopolysaccharide biosynthesis polyprenyl glycosylphosphotransferase
VLNAQAQEAVVEALPGAEAVDLVQPAYRTPAIGIATARRIAGAGRVVAIWLPVFAVTSNSLPMLDSVAASLVFAALWFVAIRHALADARVTIWALGAPLAAVVGTSGGLVLALALNNAVPGLGLPSASLLKMALAIVALSAAWESIVLASAVARHRVLVVGAANGGSELVEELSLARGSRFDVVGVVDDDRGTDQVAGAPLHGRIDQLAAIVEEHRPDIVVLANDRCRGEAFNELLEIAHVGFSVVGLAEFYEYAFGRLPVRNMNSRWFMSVLHLYQRPYARWAKRTFDVVVAGLGVLLTAPLFPILALLVRRTAGPVIYRQVRLGEGGRTFTIYKFRSMGTDAEIGVAIWAAEHDPRVTALGRFMRKTRLDELPQLWNVLCGDMSIVGPRPERPEFVEQLEAEVPFWSRRHLVKPGITGWAQVRRGYTADAASTSEKLSYDLWYLRHRSLVVDLAICVKTISTLLSGSGAR